MLDESHATPLSCIYLGMSTDHPLTHRPALPRVLDAAAVIVLRHCPLWSKDVRRQATTRSPLDVTVNLPFFSP